MSPEETAKADWNFVSAGSNKEDNCRRCIFRIPDRQNPGWGWCDQHKKASVSPTGSCDLFVTLHS